MEEYTRNERINFLCMKYFTPELCDELITESKSALKGKIVTQLIKFGEFLFQKYCKTYQLDFELFCVNVIDVIESCWKNWEKEPKNRKYSSYFAKAIQNELLKISTDKNSRSISLNEFEDSGRECADQRNLIDSQIEKSEAISLVEKYLKMVNMWFQIRKREPWNTAIVTTELYEGLHLYFDYYPERKISQFTFIDERIFMLPKVPLNKELAQFLGRDEGQISRARKKFREQVATLLSQHLSL